MATTICANGSSARKEINGTIGPRTTTIAGLKCPPSGPKSRKIVGRTMSLDPGHLFNFQLKRANTKRSWDASILTPTHSRLNRLALSSLTSRQGIPTDNCFRLASPQKKEEERQKGSTNTWLTSWTGYCATPVEMSRAIEWGFPSTLHLAFRAFPGKCHLSIRTLCWPYLLSKLR